MPNNHDTDDRTITNPPGDADETIAPGEVLSDDERTLTATGSTMAGARGAPHADTVPGYRFLGLLGEGGMGVVWEAEQERPKRRVALKVMRREHLVDDTHARMFQREADILARHRHVAGVAERLQPGQHRMCERIARGCQRDPGREKQHRRSRQPEREVRALRPRPHQHHLAAQNVRKAEISEFFCRSPGSPVLASTDPIRE